MMMSKGIGMFDLEKHYSFYGAYHTNPMNVLVHTLLVWPNVFAALLFLYAAPPILDPSKLGLFGGVLRLDVGLIHALIHAILYVRMDKKSGALAALLCFSCWVGSSFLAAQIGVSLAMKVGVAAQVVCWAGQFLAHGLFEKRSPGMEDNTVHAYLMGPFYLLLQVLQFVGYEPYPGFNKRVDSQIEVEIKKCTEKQQLKKVK
ncbi:unnamed protein product [Microthlaspi erraticum]|uniref:DUF962 domain-containing protein n=1 Tax=Microthlaspi erraticum TaxID=1685480 RepID=A0A6D2K587_9BRAS|nr:unnamed protein product [Microthlaspi erraticum]